MGTTPPLIKGVRRCRELVELAHVVEATAAVNEKTVAPAATPTLLVPYNSSRIKLVISYGIFVNGATFIANRKDVSASNGLSMLQNPSWSIKWTEDLDSVVAEWWAVCAAANETLYIREILLQ
jgi:hypothetical protein